MLRKIYRKIRDSLILNAVRSGSKQVENKNIHPFAGSSLLEVKIRQLVSCTSKNTAIRLLTVGVRRAI